MKANMKLFHELISHYAATTPEKIALQDAFGEMSYHDLEMTSASCSEALIALGVKQGDTVAVYVPYVKEIMVGAVAALRTGGIFAPFDSAYPEKRLEYMLEDSEATAILTTREFWNSRKLNFPEERVVFIDQCSSPNPHSSDLSPQPLALTPESPAMLVYTSGTTGKPKGVLHIHQMLLRIADCIKVHDGAEMNADTRSGIMTSFPFIGTMMMMIGPLNCGGTLCIPPEIARQDMTSLYQFIQEARLTHIYLPSGLAAMMAEDYDLSGIVILAAGDKLRNFQPHNPGIALINLYGSTEVGPIISKKIFGNEERISVGKAYHNTLTQIVDEQMNPVKQGEVGELLISNSHMSTLYLKLPEMTKEKWIMKDGKKWFRIGDRVTCTEEGDLIVLGRVDNMVKLRGFRIETGEVEAQIGNAIVKLNRTDVGQLVVVLKNIGGIDHLCCYYEAPKDLDKNAVKAEIVDYLAEYMIPDVWVRMDILPRNMNGKVMRKELPLPKREYKSSGVIDSEVLFRVITTTADILGSEEYIGPDERFTDAGGTSLYAMKLAVALREQGIKITGSQILQYNTLRKIADNAAVAYEQLWSFQEYEDIRNDFASRGEHIEKVLPISNKQDEMLFRQLIFPDSHNYRNVVYLQVDSKLSESHLREALDVIAQENEELRSAIVFHNVTAIQQVITDRKIPLEIIDEQDYKVQSLHKLRDSLFNEHIDFQYNCLMKMVCLRTSEKSFLYVLTHNIAISQEQLRHYMLKFMQELGNHYPDDASISGWIEMLKEGIDMFEQEHGEKSHDGHTESLPVIPTSGSGMPSSPIRVYSENNGPKIVFVHTGNTGSDAYYRLAARIGDKYSFAVIEPYNLYHPDDVRHGIKNIATNYVRILKEHQPEGPYILGGWCYGGVVAHEIACQLRQAGEEVRHLIMLDSHALGDNHLREMSKGMFSDINASYFETCPLFAELREAGMLEAMIKNAINVAEDMTHHSPSFFDGNVTYFKPDQIPAGVTGDNRKYWEKMMEFEAGNYENYCDKAKLHIIHTPHEHDLMMDDESLDIIVPEIDKILHLC